MDHSLQDVALLIKRAQNRHHKLLDATLVESGLSLVQWDALRHLDQNPNASLHDLATLTFQSDQAFGTLSARMVDRGLVERIPGPGRAVRLRPTDKGRALLDEGYEVVDRALATTFAPLTQRQLDQLAGLLATMVGPPPEPR